MIPKLFPATATTFTTNGITLLTDCVSCVVTEERNGPFELEMEVMTSTPYFDSIEVGALIVVNPNHTQTSQAFEIYEISKPIDQKVTVRAQHISYRMSYIPITPFSATGITATIAGLSSNALETDPFTITTTLTNEASTYNQTEPGSLRSRLGGTEGSLLDVFGGEYEWDNFTVKLKAARGADNGVQLRLAKNITELDQDLEFDRVVTGALPYWVSQDGLTSMYGNIQYSATAGDYAYKRTVLFDCSDQFETTPTTSQLDSAAQQFLNQASLATPSNSVSVSFVDLADTAEYSNSALERVNLCDTVEVIYPALGIGYKQKAVKVVFDVLAERTLEVEIGDARSSMAKTLNDLIGDNSEVVSIGKKLISITQLIDRENGAIISRVETVEEKANNNATEINNLATTVQQTAAGIQIDISEIEQQVTDNTTDISEMHTYIDFDASGVTVGKSDSDVRGVFGNSSLDFIDQDNNKLAWLDADDGLGANGISLGDPSDATKRWQIVPNELADHLYFIRRN